MSETKGTKIAILFLASQGIAKPNIWRRWREKLGKMTNKVVFYGIMPKEVEGWIKLPVRIPRQWCGVDLAVAYQQGLKQILKDPSIAYILFVSGQDIPIRSPDVSLLNPDTPSQLCDFQPFPEQESPQLMEKYKDLFPLLYMSTQWVGLNRKDAQTVAEHSFDYLLDFEKEHHRKLTPDMREYLMSQNLLRKKLIEKALEEKKESPANLEGRKQILHLTARARERLEKYDTIRHEWVPCPDEYFVPSMLQKYALPGRKFSKQCTTSGRKLNYQPSPITWDSWDQKIDFSLTPSPDERTLVNEIQRGCANGALFFRKVSSLLPDYVDQKKTNPWDLCDRKQKKR